MTKTSIQRYFLFPHNHLLWDYQCYKDHKSGKRSFDKLHWYISRHVSNPFTLRNRKWRTFLKALKEYFRRMIELSAGLLMKAVKWKKKKYQYHLTSFRKKRTTSLFETSHKMSLPKMSLFGKIYMLRVKNAIQFFSPWNIMGKTYSKPLSTHVSSILTRFSIKCHFPSIITTYVKTIEKPNTIIDVSDNMVAEAMSLKDLATLTNAWTPRSLLFESRKTLIKWFSNSNVLCSTWKRIIFFQSYF